CRLLADDDADLPGGAVDQDAVTLGIGGGHLEQDLTGYAGIELLTKITDECFGISEGENAWLSIAVRGPARAEVGTGVVAPLRVLSHRSDAHNAHHGSAEQRNDTLKFLRGGIVRVVGHEIRQRRITHAPDANVLARAAQAGAWAACGGGG